MIHWHISFILTREYLAIFQISLSWIPISEWGFGKRGWLNQSYRPQANFMRHLRIARFLDDGNVELLKDRLVRARGEDYSVATIPDRDALVETIVENFDMPRDVAREVADELDWPPDG